ncbi:MAG: DUF1320 domain-containing protein [Pyrinomonadaceae bacterium]
MTYITQQDLEDQLGLDKLIQLTDNTRSGVVDVTVVGRAIEYAESTFNAYARTRYTIPVPVTELVKSKCLDLAEYKLKRSRATTGEAIDNLKKSLYDPTIKFLEALQSGRAALDVPAAEETATAPATGDKVLKGSPNTKFTDSNLNNY